MLKNIVFIFTVFFFSCKENVVELLPSKIDFPDQESWGVKILLTKEGRLRAEVTSGHLEKYNDKQFIILNELVKVNFYDDDESSSSVITSESAEVDQISNDMKAIGSVVAVSDSGITLFSETLTYNSKEERLFTQDSIKITTLEFDTLYGIGFESDLGLKNWYILKPSGVTDRGFK